MPSANTTAGGAVIPPWSATYLGFGLCLLFGELTAYHVGVIRLAQLQGELDRLRRRKDAVDSEIGALTKQLEDVARTTAMYDTMEQRLEELRAGIGEATFQRKRQVFEILDVTLHADGNELWLTRLFPHKIVIAWDA